MKVYFVDGENSLKATAVIVFNGNFHWVVYVTHFMSAHLILNVQTEHWGNKKTKEEEYVK